MFRKLATFSLFPFLLYGLTAAIEDEQKIIPWFTGPLLAQTAAVIPAGSWNIEPYFFAIKTPAVYDNSWTPQNIPDHWSLSAQIPIWIGLCDWVDIEFQPTLSWIHAQGAGAHWALRDFIFQIDFQLHRDEIPHKSWLPSIKLALRETVPMGKYRNLEPKKASTDLGGAGSWATAVGLVFGKTFHLTSYYFFSSRLSLIYTLPAPVHVKGLNAYGGGFRTNGTVYPGQNFQADWAFEVSLSRNWAFAFDVLATWQSKTKFSGNPGFSLSGGKPETAPQNLIVGSTASENNKSYIQYSLAPAVEYNFNENLGIIAGTWFTVAGKNVGEFYSAVVAINYYK